MFQMDAKAGAQGFAHLRWSERGERRDGMTRSEGCYLLRSNVTDWSGEKLRRACIQLTEAEEAFRLHKSDLVMRPLWRRKEQRVQARILVCFPACLLQTRREDFAMPALKNGSSAEFVGRQGP